MARTRQERHQYSDSSKKKKKEKEKERKKKRKKKEARKERKKNKNAGGYSTDVSFIPESAGEMTFAVFQIVLNSSNDGQRTAC